MCGANFSDSCYEGMTEELNSNEILAAASPEPMSYSQKKILAQPRVRT
jgi:hypothetical protein